MALYTLLLYYQGCPGNSQNHTEKRSLSPKLFI